MIDCHVHLRDWEQEQKETIFHGMAVAQKAHLTALFDMPNTNPPLTSSKVLEKRLTFGTEQTAKVSNELSYCVYAGLTSNKEQIQDVVSFYNKNKACIGLKLFAGHSTGNMGLITFEEQQSVYATLAKLNYTGVLAVHCEKESLIKNELFSLEAPESHSLARSEIAEVESIKDQISLARTTGFKGHLHICHISTRDGIELVTKAKSEGLAISCGATAHHALLNTESYKDFGILAKMNPPLRSEENRVAVFNSLLSGKIDNIESDHAPHTLTDKRAGASGIPGFQGFLLLIKTLREKGASEELLKKLAGENVNKIYNTSFKVTVPTNLQIMEALQLIKDEYDFNLFS